MKLPAVRTYTSDILYLVSPLRVAIQRVLSESTYQIRIAQTVRSRKYQEFLYWCGRNPQKAAAIAKEIGIHDNDVHRIRTHTMHSRHIIGCAVDMYVIENGRLASCPRVYLYLYDLLRRHCSMDIVWGGSYGDYGHYEIRVSDTVYRRALSYVGDDWYDIEGIERVLKSY